MTWCNICDECSRESPCLGKLRSVFVTCLQYYMESRVNQAARKTRSFVESPTLCSRKSEEYIADFERTCYAQCAGEFDRQTMRRRLSGLRARTEDAAQRLLHMEFSIGRAILGQRPYSLHPPADYMGRPIRTGQTERIERELRKWSRELTPADEAWLRSVGQHRMYLRGRGQI